MRIRHKPEVYGLFAACIPQAARAHVDGMPTHKRQGLVPDFFVHVELDGPARPLLLELKTLHYGSSTYAATGARCAAVGRRAARLPQEYAAKARAVDRRYCGTLPGMVGPVERKLLTYEPVRGLVFGAWGEASPVVTRLLSIMAHTGAQRHWRGMRCDDPTQAVGALAWLLRRRWGLTALQEAARLKLHGLEHVGRGAAEAARRRGNAEATHAARTRAHALGFASGPRVQRDRRGPG